MTKPETRINDEYRMMKRRSLGACALVLAVLMTLQSPRPARAVIGVGRGNDPVRDDDWPAGALELANLKTRVGWWEGPPFGGGQHNFLYRGNAAALQNALDLFAAIKTPVLRIVVHDGAGPESPFLQDSDNPKADTHYDWSFTVWNPNNWNHLYNTPGEYFSAEDPGGEFGKSVDPPRMDLFIGGQGGIDFSKLKLPTNASVTDERADAAGFAGGSVVIGDVYDLITSKPIARAQIILSQLIIQDAWKTVASGESNGAGHFELTHIPAGSYRVSLSAAGYASRLLGYDSFGGNTIKRYTAQLVPASNCHGTVVDTDGKPITGAAVRVDAMIGPDGRGYIVPEPMETRTDAAGHWELSGLPRGHALLYVSHDRFQMLNVLQLHAVPDDNISLQMTATGAVKGRVVLSDGKPAEHGNVSVNPPGDPIGKWGGSMNTHPDGAFEFSDVPPGEYRVSAMASNPESTPRGENPNIKTITVKAGETTDVTVTGW